MLYIIYMVITGMEIQTKNYRFRMDEKIGAGGFSTVHRGECIGFVTNDTSLPAQSNTSSGDNTDPQTANQDSIQLGDKVAIKVINHEKLTPRKKKQIETELRILRKLKRNASHYHLLQYIDHYYDKEAGMLYIVTRLYGDDLSRRKITRLDQKIRVGLQLCQAMKYLHSHDIVHLDLKPQNILMTSPTKPTATSNSPKGGTWGVTVVDFGLACRLSDPDYHYKGTRSYVAPEILNNYLVNKKMGKVNTIDLKACDVYSMGILFMCMNGKHPYKEWITEAEWETIIREKINTKNAAILLDILYAHLPLKTAQVGDAKIALMQEIKFTELCLRMIQLNPSHRPSIDEIITELKAITAPILPRPVET